MSRRMASRHAGRTGVADRNGQWESEPSLQDFESWRLGFDIDKEYNIPVESMRPHC